MSRIGKKIIEIPAGTEIKIDGTTIAVKGKLGELVRTFKDVVTVEQTAEGVSVNPIDDSKFARAM